MEIHRLFGYRSFTMRLWGPFSFSPLSDLEGSLCLMVEKATTIKPSGAVRNSFFPWLCRDRAENVAKGSNLNMTAPLISPFMYSSFYNLGGWFQPIRILFSMGKWWNSNHHWNLSWGNTLTSHLLTSFKNNQCGCMLSPLSEGTGSTPRGGWRRIPQRFPANWCESVHHLFQMKGNHLKKLG